MDTYYEKNIINERILQDDSHVKRYKTLRIVCTAVLAIGIMLALVYLRWESFLIFFNLFIYACIIAPTTAGILFATRMLQKHNCEYDYILSGTDFRVIRIYDQKKRTRIVSTDVVNFLKIGYTSDADFEKLKQMSKLKKVQAFCNEREVYLYVYCTVNGERTIVLCEFDDEFLSHLKKIVPSITVFCDEIRRKRV